MTFDEIDMALVDIRPNQVAEFLTGTRLKWSVAVYPNGDYNLFRYSDDRIFESVGEYVFPPDGKRWSLKTLRRYLMLRAKDIEWVVIDYPTP
jgi:hypothetical protein